jgi:hypothetical protein
MSSRANIKEKRKYQSKLDRVINILQAMEVPYENWRDEIYTISNPGYELSRKNAEKILSLFGINKPKNFNY